jgi:hypothetical protein
LAALQIENNLKLRVVHFEDSNVLHLNFPGNNKMLKTSSSLFLSKLNIPLSQQFARLIYLSLDFQPQIDNK